jgi:phosphohistidine phosphatase
VWLVPEVEVVLSTPFVRTWQTAEILEQAGFPTPVSFEALERDYPPHKVLDALVRYDGLCSVALIGHRPSLHELASYLLTGDAGGAHVQIKKAARSTTSSTAAPNRAGSLRLLLTPRALRAVGKNQLPAAGG